MSIEKRMIKHYAKDIAIIVGIGIVYAFLMSNLLDFCLQFLATLH